ncbi:DNA primase [Saccharophagus degradans]|uniref:DNA primase n=1 Tax=Saccharophagus degradans TaxID=86304 RepID=A0AAW7X6L3_9GAMM|nr:DNA primase [Saccharophagus degradans]MDO6423069.1 DNA primase [Saccharophagus degradans]MDO6607407.1 DNA primase [Saccharophagus degradans]
MSRIPQSFIDDLLNRLDIVEVIDHRVKLKKAGKNYSACCPFHEEKTPSFTVSPDKQFYYCFGCGANGNAVGFLMEYERQGFVDAVESLARVAGMQVPKETTEKDVKHAKKQRGLYDILGLASTYYQKQLKEHTSRERAVSYLKGRGLSGAIARDFGMGYAPPGWDNLLVKLGTNEEDRHLLVESGLVIRKEGEGKLYDRFRHRIMFPIKDTRGRVIGFGGRVLGDDKPKYLNSPETPVFSKGRELYGLYEARQSNRKLERLLVVEGYMDVIALAQYGMRNAVATLGTACGEDHLKLAFRYVNEVVFCFDGDNAGRTAAKRALVNALPAMEDGRQIRFLFLPEGQDPDTLVRQIGAERFTAQIENGVPLEEFLFDAVAEGIDVNSMEGRARFGKLAAPLLNTLPNGIYRELMFANLAKRTGLSLDLLLELTKEKVSLVAEPAKPEANQQPQPEPELPAHLGANIGGNISASTPPHLDESYAHIPPLEPDYVARTAQTSAPKPAPVKRSSITLNPVRLCTILLLEYPKLVATLNNIPARAETEDEELTRLFDLIEYIQQRPNCSFNSILGYWGGRYGIEQQQALADLVANQLMGSVRSVENYNPEQELEQSLARIGQKLQKANNQKELAKLQAKGLGNLNNEEKERFRELVRLQHQQT